MKLFWLVVHHVFQRLDKLLRNFSKEKIQIQVSIQMKLFVMVLPFKVVWFVVKNQNKQMNLLLLMQLHWVWVSKLLVVLWIKSFQRDHSFQPKNHKSSLHMLTTKQLLQLQCLKVKDHWLKTITNWDNSI